MITAAAAALFAFAYLLPQDLWNTHKAYLCLCLVAFTVRLLQLQIGIALILLAAGAVCCRRRKLAAAALTVGLLAVSPILWRALPLRSGAPGIPVLRVMSVNLKASNRDGAAIGRSVRAADPDVVFMQEFAFFHEAALRPSLAAAYPYVKITNISSGVAIYSKLPLRVSDDRRFEGLESQKRARYEINVGHSTLALYVVQVPRFTASLTSFGQSRVELARLLAYVAADPLPVIVAGDFNFTEQTPNAGALCELGLQSAHALAGQGLATTRRLELPVLRRLFAFRLDHIFVEPPLGASRFSVGQPTGSDHLPVIADIVFAHAAPDGPPGGGTVEEAVLPPPGRDVSAIPPPQRGGP